MLELFEDHTSNQKNSLLITEKSTDYFFQLLSQDTVTYKQDCAKAGTNTLYHTLTKRKNDRKVETIQYY